MLFMHCGWVRTGTTSLQAALVAHQGELSTAGIVYPDRWRRDGNDNHHGIVELLESSPGEAKAELRRFQHELGSLAGGTVLVSCEDLTYWAVDGKRATLLGVLAAARGTMPVTCIWTLRNVVETVKSLYHRQMLIQRPVPPPPTEVIGRLLARPDWPEAMFAGLYRLESAVDDTVYLNYTCHGSHSRELLRIVGVTPPLSTSIDRWLNKKPPLNARLSHKAAVTILHRDKVSARAGFEMTKTDLADLFYRGEFKFEDDRRCDLFDYQEAMDLHEKALSAARDCGFLPYLQFFENDEPEIPGQADIDPDVLTDEDLDRLVACLQHAQVAD